MHLFLLDLAVTAAAQAGAAFPDAGGMLAEVTVPDSPPTPIPGMDDMATTFVGWGKWVLLIIGSLGLFICGGMMIMGRRNRSATAVDGAVGIPWVLGGLSMAVVAASLVGFFV